MPRYRSLVLPVLLLSALAVGLSIRTRHVRPPQARPYGRFTAQQILDRSEPVCRLLAPQAHSLSLVAEPTTQQTAHPCWNVTCSNQTGQPRAYLTWDALSGQLWCVGVPPPPPGKRPSLPLTAPEAVAASWRWLRMLGLAASAAHWQLGGKPQQLWGNWTLTWQAEDCRAEVKVNTNTRELVSLRCFPRSVAFSSGDLKSGH
jgi:hypothetical protein